MRSPAQVRSLPISLGASLALVASAGCRSDDPSSTPTETPAPEAAAAPSGPPPQVVAPDEASSASEITQAVAKCLGWTLEQPRCLAGSDVVTFGLSEAVGNPALGRSAAASRARAELAEQLGRRTPTVRLRGSRVPRVIPCGDRYLALAVLRAELEAEPCPSGFATLAPEADSEAGAAPDAPDTPDAPACPAWVYGFGEATERGYLGVGAATGLSSEALEQQTARHRAVNNAISVHETELRGGRAMLLGKRTPSRVLSARSAQCRGVTFVEVEVELVDDAPSEAAP